MTKFEVEFYETETGRQPAKDFLLSLDKKMRAKMLHTISILQDNGHELREPYSKHLFDKKAKKTPSKEIKLAKKYRENYLLRRENENERKI